MLVLTGVERAEISGTCSGWPSFRSITDWTWLSGNERPLPMCPTKKPRMNFWDEAAFADQTADRLVPTRFSIRKNLQAGADVIYSGSKSFPASRT